VVPGTLRSRGWAPCPPVNRRVPTVVTRLARRLVVTAIGVLMFVVWIYDVGGLRTWVAQLLTNQITSGLPGKG